MSFLSLSPALYMQPDGATIKSISENIVVNPGDEAKLSCAVDGKFRGKRESFFSAIVLRSDGSLFSFLSSRY